MGATVAPHRAKDHYHARLDELRATLRALEARANRISTLRGLTFLGAALTAGARVFRPLPPLVWAISALFALVFAGLVIAHAVLVSRMSAAETRVRLAERGLARIAGELAAVPRRGDRFVTPGHPYAGDLDIFGPSSLFQLVNAAETGAGERVLAAWLSAPADAAEVAARAEAARELAAMPAYREELAVDGIEAGSAGRDVEPLAAWAERRMGDKVAPALPRPLVRVGQAFVAITIALFTLSQIAGDTLGPWKNLWLVPLVAQIVVLALLRASIEPALTIVASPEEPFSRVAAMIRRVEGQAFAAPRLTSLRAVLTGDTGVDASRAIGRLQRIVSFAELRHSGLVHVLANLFLLWDVFCASALDRWRDRWGERVAAWLTALAEVEALASLGTFAFEHPHYAFPEVDDSALHFEAEGLGHPLIQEERRVVNDVTIDGPGKALFISGSNMSGKSTLLRSIGISAVLALAGAPVCARRLRMAPCRVYTSMRISDSLEAGVSHFYAELERLKGVVDAVGRGEKVLFLLDEILHGTNSRERQLGGKAVVLRLLAEGAVGAVSSHDLGLASLAEESGGRVTNVHFEETVREDKMSFDYKLKPGVVASANALRLMRIVGIAVDLPEA